MGNFQFFQLFSTIFQFSRGIFNFSNFSIYFQFSNFPIFQSFQFFLFPLDPAPQVQNDEHIPAKMKLCVKLHINTHLNEKMPPAGLEPATFAFAAQTITQLTKWADGFSHILRKILCNTCAPKMSPFAS